MTYRCEINGAVAPSPQANYCRAVRKEHVRIIVDDLRHYLELRLRQVSEKSRLVDAIRYAVSRWDGIVT